MSPDTAVALIVLSGVILTAVIGLAGTIITVWWSGKKDQREQRSAEKDRHRENADKLDALAAALAQVQAELPEDGLAAWGRTIAANTKALAAQAKATTQLSESVASLSDRLVTVETTVATMQGGLA